jgi:hypothetical protein
MNVVLTTDGGREKAVRTSKLGAALLVDPSIVEEKAYRKKGAKIRIFKKIEASKQRPVASVSEDNVVFNWAYLWQYLSTMFSGAEVTTIGLSKKQTIQAWIRASERAGDRGLYKFALDQTEFDHSITPRQHLAFLDSVKRAITRRYGYKKEVDSAVEQIKFSVKNAILNTGRDVVSDVQGFWSGLPYTIIGDTAMNCAEFLLVNEEYERRFGANYLYDARFQGDDVESWFRKDVKDEFISIYEELGFKISKTKSSMSREFDDFLRFSVSDRRVSGYPASMVKSVMWSRANEVSDERREGGIVNEIASVWWGLMIRDLDHDKVVRHACVDLSRALKCSVDHAKTLLYTSTSFGGGGYGDERKFSIKAQSGGDSGASVKDLEQSYVYKAIDGSAETKRDILNPYLLKLTDASKYQNKATFTEEFIGLGPAKPYSYVQLYDVKVTTNEAASWLYKAPPFSGSSILSSIQLEVYVRERQFEKIPYLYKDPGLVNRARNWLRRSVWVDWLQGKLWSASFRNTKVGPIMGSGLVDFVYAKVLKRLVDYNSINRVGVQLLNSRVAATARRLSENMVYDLRF